METAVAWKWQKDFGLMDLRITSEKIANPLLVELLKKLTDSFNRMGREFYVIGATARDIIIR